MKASSLFIMILTGATMYTQNILAQSWWDLAPTEVRARINQRIMSIEAPVPEVGSVEDRLVQCTNRNTILRIYTPNEGDHFPIILLIHGGAWVAGNIDTHDNLARYLCSKAQAVVVSVGYLNAPEGKFPLPLEQCYDALSWATEHADELSADASMLAVAGDSAGGNMAAALCLMTRDRNGPKIALQVLINPATDLTCGGTLERKEDGLDILRWQAVQYLSASSEANHPYVSPLTAKDLNNLPPAVVILAENDDLREAGQKYAERLYSAGIPTQIYCQTGIGHLAGDGARASLRAKPSLDVAVTALQNVFPKNKKFP